MPISITRDHGRACLAGDRWADFGLESEIMLLFVRKGTDVIGGGREDSPWEEVSALRCNRRCI